MRPNPQKTADLVTFTEEILNGKLYFLCSVYSDTVALFYSALFARLLFTLYSLRLFMYLLVSRVLIR